MKPVYIFLLLLIPIGSLKAQTKPLSAAKRLEQFKSAKPSDPFMQLFLDFAVKNGVAENLVALETDLYSRKFMKGFDPVSARKYLTSTARQAKDNRCVAKTLMEGFKGTYQLFDYTEYQKKVEASGQKGTKEFVFLEYIKEEGAQWREALLYALENNTLSVEKKYYYLWLTMPAKVCQ